LTELAHSIVQVRQLFRELTQHGE